MKYNFTKTMVALSDTFELNGRRRHCDAHAIAAPVLLHYLDYSGESLDAGP